MGHGAPTSFEERLLLEWTSSVMPLIRGPSCPFPLIDNDDNYDNNSMSACGNSSDTDSGILNEILYFLMVPNILIQKDYSLTKLLPCPSFH